MRIVLKTGGLVIIGLALSGLTFVAVKGAQRKTQPAVTQATTVSKSGAENLDVPHASGNLLRNGDFEDVFVETKTDVLNGPGRIRGTNGTNWQDNSGWADIVVTYDAETNNPHGGKSCQKITISDKKVGQAQFLQRVKLRQGRNLGATLWVRAESPLPVALELRDPTNVNAPYGRTSVTIGVEWQKVEVSGKLLKDDNTALMLVVQNPGTIWVDDAAVDELP